MNISKSAPLYEKIYKKIKEAIISGELKGGERITDTMFAEVFKVSRSPVREAFRKLEQDGFLVNKDGIVLVYKPNVTDVIELFEVRAGLESMAVYLSASVISDEEVTYLKETIEDVKVAFKENKMQEVIHLNTHFHDKLIRISNNQRLIEMMDNIDSLIYLYRSFSFTQFNGNSNFIQEHTNIIGALELRNATLASEKMKEHILNDLNSLIQKLKYK